MELKQSAIFHTRSTCASDPSTTHTATNTEYTFTAFGPNRYLIFACPKKYQPIIVENAKKNIQIAIKISQPFPYNVENAYWLNSAPVLPLGIDFVVIITNAVRFSTINVSINTPIIATKPCSTG